MTKDNKAKKLKKPLNQSAVEGFVMPEFGANITVDQMFVRSVDYDKGNYKYWKAIAINKTGIFLGKRKLANGHVEHCSYDGSIFTPKEHIDAALVCFSAREKPVYVPLEAIKA